MIDPQFENFVCDRLHLPQPIFTALAVKINTRERVARVLTSSADAYVTSYEISGGEISYRGRCNMRILAVDEAYAIQSYAYSAEFADKMPLGDIKGGDIRAFFDVLVADIITTPESTALNVEALLETRARVFVRHEMPCMVADAGLVLRQGEFELGRISNATEVSAAVSAQLEVNGNIARVLAAESFINLSSCRVEDDILELHGAATVCLTYLTPDAVLVHTLLPFDFSEQAACEGFGGAEIITASAAVRSTKIHIDILEEQNNNSFGVEINIGVNVVSYEKEVRQAACDAYSLTRRIETVSDAVRASLPDGRYAKTVKVEQNVPINAPIERLVAVTNLKVAILGVTAGAQNAAVEGTLCGDIIFESEGRMAATQFKLPFSESIEGQNLDLTSVLFGGGTVATLAYRMDKRSAAISATVNLWVDAMRNVSLTVLAGATEAEELVAETAAIEVCIARKGDTLWDIGKQLNMRAEHILEINPDLVTPLEKDAKIVIYHQL